MGLIYIETPCMYVSINVSLCVYVPIWKCMSESVYRVSQNRCCTVGWGSRIHRLHLFRGVRPLPNECPWYGTKRSDGEVLVMPELWGMRSTPSLPSLPCLLWLGIVVPDRVLSMDQIELNGVLMLNRITWNRSALIFKLRTYAKLNCLK